MFWLDYGSVSWPFVHKSSILTQELNCMLLLGYKFTVCKCNINNSKIWVKLEIYAKKNRLMNLILNLLNLYIYYVQDLQSECDNWIGKISLIEVQ